MVQWMRMWCVVFLGCAAMVAAGCMTRYQPAADQGKTYPVILARPQRVGDQFSLKIEFSGDQARTFEYPTGPVSERYLSDWRIEGELRVLGVHPGGAIARAEIQVKRMEQSFRKPEEPVDFQEVAAPGDWILLDHTRTPRAVIYLNGKVEGRLSGLGDVLNLTTDVASTNPVLPFQPRGPQRMGATWQPDCRLLKNLIEEVGTECRLENLSGEVSLTGVRDVEGTECVELRFSYVARDLMPKADGDENTVVKTFSNSAEGQMVVPVDPARRDYRSRYTTTYITHGTTSRNGQEVPYVRVLTIKSSRTEKQIGSGPEPAGTPRAQPATRPLERGA